MRSPQADMPFDLTNLVKTRLGENYDLHERHLNKTLVRVQRSIGFDKIYSRAEGAYLYDRAGNQYLDFLSGYGVFNIGRNHPVVKKAIRDVLDLDLPNMVQMDCSLLSGLLAEALLKRLPCDAMFFCNSGTEANEGALKFARAATGRERILSLESSYHGLTYGSLSATGTDHFREGFGPLLSGCERVPLDDLATLERALNKRDVAAFIVEPVQGKSVKSPASDYFKRAQELCRKYGTLFICDEVQTGLGRTGRWFGFEHWGLEPDIVTMAKSLSGGYVPCGAIATSREIYQKTFSSMERCVVHSSTFGRNNLAMACGLAALSVIEDERLVENAERMGALLLEKLEGLKTKYPFIKEVRGRGLMIAIEFREPAEFRAKLTWKFVHKIDKSLFPQMIVTPLLTRHRILTQVASHNSDVVKILPPLVITERDVDYFIGAFDSVLADCHKFPGPISELAMNIARHAFKTREVEQPSELELVER